MAGVFITAFLALAGPAVAVSSTKSARQTDDSAALAPVTIISDDVVTLAPIYNVSLPYGNLYTDLSLVNVNLTTSHPSILLETLSTIVSVDCASDSVSVVFDNADDLTSAYSEWSSHSVLVFVTNHMGDCDSEIERGFFTASSYTTDESILTLMASTQKTSISDVACKIRVSSHSVAEVNSCLLTL